MHPLTKLIHDDMIPALGVTEPGAIAFAAARARSLTKGPIQSVAVAMNSGLYKNAFTCGIPNSHAVGNVFSAALGVVAGNWEKGLEALADVTEADNAAAQALVDQGKIKVTLSGIDSTIFLEATVTTETDTCTVTIRGSHTNIVSIVCNGATIFEKAADHAAEPGEEPTPTPEPTPSPTPELPDAVKKALPAVECALDVVMDGTKFDASNGKSFWNVMARYLSRSNSSDDDGTFTVTKGQVLDAAKSVFSGITELPDVPENSSVVTLVPSEEEGSEDQYQLLWGATGGHDLEVTAYEDGVMTVLVDGDKTYQVTLDDSGAIVSVKEA